MPGLCEAIQTGNVDLVRELLVSGADSNLWDTDPEETMLFQFDTTGPMNLAEGIQELVIRGGEAVIGQSYAPLMLASSLGHAEISVLLLEYGARVNFQDPAFKNSALILAAQNGHDDVVQHLLAHKANLKLQNTLGCDALFMASQMGHHIVISTLASHGNDVNTKRFDGYTPLMIASKSGHTEAIKTLLELGADINAMSLTEQKESNLPSSILAMTPNKCNALYIAYKKAQIEALKVLIANGANFSFLDWSQLRADARYTKTMDAALAVNIILKIKTPSFFNYLDILMIDRNGESLPGTYSLFSGQYKTLDNDNIQIFADMVTHYLTKTTIICNISALEEYLTEKASLYPKAIIEKTQEAITIYKVVDCLLKGEIYEGENLKDLNQTLINKIYNLFKSRISKEGIKQDSLEAFTKALNHDLLPDNLIEKVIALIETAEENLASFESGLRALFEGISPMPTTLIKKGLGKGFDTEIYDEDTIKYYQENPEETTNTGLYLSKLDIRGLTELFLDETQNYREFVITSFKLFDHSSYILPTKIKLLFEQVVHIAAAIPVEPETVTIEDFLAKADATLAGEALDAEGF